MVETVNPYHLTRERLTMPEGKREEQMTWFNELIAYQSEGVSAGFTPQFPNASEAFMKSWIARVWRPFFKKMCESDIGDGEGGEFHSFRHIEPGI